MSKKSKQKYGVSNTLKLIPTAFPVPTSFDIDESVGYVEINGEPILRGKTIETETWYANLEEAYTKHKCVHKKAPIEIHVGRLLYKKICFVLGCDFNAGYVNEGDSFYRGLKYTGVLNTDTIYFLNIDVKLNHLLGPEEIYTITKLLNNIIIVNNNERQYNLE